MTTSEPITKSTLSDQETLIPQELLGKVRAKAILDEVKDTAAQWAKQGFVPHMVSVLASEDEASRVYVESKARKAESLGVRFSVHKLPEGGTQADLNALLQRLSDDDDIHGIVLQMPVAKGLDADEAMLQITARKDIEGFTPHNIALFAAGREAEAILPPTPHAVRYLLEDALGDLRGKRVAVVGPGRTVGRPLIFMLNNKGATVTICNEHTRNLSEVLAPQDAVAVAVGRAHLIRAEHVQPHHVIVDAGINVQEDGQILGDAEADLPVQMQTPVPRGVGPLTRALMYKNLIRAVQLQQKMQ